MSARGNIINSLVTQLKEIDADVSPFDNSYTFQSNLFSNVHNQLIYVDEVNDFPTLSVVASSETREYHPSGFKWGFLTVILRLYVNDEDDPVLEMEKILEDIEHVLDNNRSMTYQDSDTIIEIDIQSIDTDEGLLKPLGIAEVVISIQYEVKI